MQTFHIRPVSVSSRDDLIHRGISPLFARLYAARGVQHCEELDSGLTALLPYASLKNIAAMNSRLWILRHR